LIKVETYRDKDSKISHGYFSWYDANGNIDSSGPRFKGKKNGKWFSYSDTLSVVLERQYVNGRLMKTIDYTDSVRKVEDSLPGDRPASFGDDVRGWRKYLERNLDCPERAITLGRHGNVMIDFTVDTVGKVEFQQVARSVEFSLDQEAIRLITKSKDWIPGIHMGKPAESYLRQPITFECP
jgi:TonB family protein